MLLFRTEYVSKWIKLQYFEKGIRTFDQRQKAPLKRPVLYLMYFSEQSLFESVPDYFALCI